jgi:hypothetical protein
MGSLFLPGPGPWEPPPLISGTSGPAFTAVTATETLTFSETAGPQFAGVHTHRC